MNKIPNLSHVRLRRAEIAKRRAALGEEDAILNEEDKELEIAERVLLRLAPAGGAHQAGPSISSPAELVFSKRSKLTMKGMIAKALEEAELLWISANDVKEAVSIIKGADVPMPSISPTLSVMKKEGTILRDGLRIALANRVGNNETPHDNKSKDVSIVTGEADTSPNENQNSPKRDIFG